MHRHCAQCHSVSPITMHKHYTRHDAVRKHILSDSVTLQHVCFLLCCQQGKVVGIPTLVLVKGVRSSDLFSRIKSVLSAVSAGDGCLIPQVYAAAISSCHESFGDRLVFAYPLVRHFLQGVRRQRPVMHASAPQWKLVLEALVKPL